MASMAIQEYTEDIFVGYRYFETIPGAKEKVAYPFGYGLSYTTFEITQENFKTDSETVTVTVKVKNTGTLAGKEIVQCYFSAPQKGVGEAVLDKSFIELCAFDKTELLQPGQEQLITLCFKIADMASYDAEGKRDINRPMFWKKASIRCIPAIQCVRLRLQGLLKWRNAL